ncbi:hypothetical protein ACFL4L_01645 [bacterium]
MRNSIIIASLAVCMMACENPFSTRRTEAPNTSQSQWIPPHTPEDVITNLVFAIQERNSENYMRCFMDDPESSHAFHFEPDPEAAALYPYLSQWTWAQEENMIQETFALVSQDSSLSLQFPTVIRDVISADSAAIVRQYRWVIHHNDASLPKELEGQVEMRMAEGAVGEWGIYQWIDYSISDLPSASIWKAALGGTE